MKYQTLKAQDRIQFSSSTKMMKMTIWKMNLQHHPPTFSATTVIIADMSTTIAPTTNATTVMTTHLDIQYRNAIMLITIDVFNHSRGIML